MVGTAQCVRGVFNELGILFFPGQKDHENTTFTASISILNQLKLENEPI